jgi:SAM-dependent methyltransferase
MCAEGWRWTKFTLDRHGGLVPSPDLHEVSQPSRYAVGIQAALYQSLVAEYISERRPGGRLLDLGCGKAPLYGLYSNWAAEVIRADWPQSHHGTAFIDEFCDLNAALPWPDDRFDTILMTDVIEHVVDPTATFGEVARILAPGGGTLILTTPFGYGLHEDPHDYHRLTEYKLSELCQRYGLVVTSLEPYGGPVEVVLHILSRAIARHRTGYLAHQIIAAVLSRVRLSTEVRRRLPLGYALIARKP